MIIICLCIDASNFKYKNIKMFPSKLESEAPKFNLKISSRSEDINQL